jgi:hypothetical protein
MIVEYLHRLGNIRHLKTLNSYLSGQAHFVLFAFFIAYLFAGFLAGLYFNHSASSFAS